MSRARLYISVVADVLEARDSRCESCGAPDIEHVHHIIPVSETGICSELAIEPANMMVLCNDCHVLFHPGSRNRNMWWHMQFVETRAVARWGPSDERSPEGRRPANLTQPTEVLRFLLGVECRRLEVALSIEAKREPSSRRPRSSSATSSASPPRSSAATSSAAGIDCAAPAKSAQTIPSAGWAPADLPHSGGLTDGTPHRP